MKYKKNSKKFSVKGRGEYMSKSDFIVKYYCNIDNCKEFIFSMKWPDGYICEKCGCTHYYYMKTKDCYRCANCHHDERLLTNTCFQDNKLPLNVLLYGIFLIFNDKRSISSMELAEELKVNYKTACLLQTKCRILMRNSNSSKKLDSSFYESDVAYIGSPKGKQGMGTEKQAYLVVLSTSQENQYPNFVKITEIEKDSGEQIKPFFEKFMRMGSQTILNTDGKTTYNCLKHDMIVKNEKINYQEDTHKLWFLNKIISNFSSMVLGVYHGISKRMIPLYFSEYEWRYNHRNTKNILDKIRHYLQFSSRMISDSMNAYALDRGLALS